MGLLDAWREALSEKFDRETGQSNTYHLSDGMTQEQYDEAYDRLENSENLLKGLTILGGLATGGVTGVAGHAALGTGAALGLLAGEDQTYGQETDRKSVLRGYVNNKGGQGEDISKNEEALSEGQGEDKKEESNSPDYDVDEMAGEFILGAWGNGQDRIDNMLNAGYTLDDYNKIQQRVNEAYASGRDLHEWTNKANEKLHYW